jgi:HAD superfamily hydrolase (TIGR01549 family)
MPSAIIFDVDGTLVDSVDLHAKAWQDAFRHFGKEIPFPDIRSQIGKGGDQIMPVFFSEEELQRFGEQMQDYRTQLFKAAYMDQVRPFPHVRELFERIRASGARIALASSAETDEFESNLRLLKVGDLIDARTNAGDAARSKPFPDIFEAALAKLPGVQPSQAVAVGDTPYDAMAATQIGVRTLGLLCGGFAEPDLRQAGCSEIWRDPADLLASFDRSLLAA